MIILNGGMKTCTLYVNLQTRIQYETASFLHAKSGRFTTTKFS